MNHKWKSFDLFPNRFFLPAYTPPPGYNAPVYRPTQNPLRGLVNPGLETGNSAIERTGQTIHTLNWLSPILRFIEFFLFVYSGKLKTQYLKAVSHFELSGWPKVTKHCKQSLPNYYPCTFLFLLLWNSLWFKCLEREDSVKHMPSLL